MRRTRTLAFARLTCAGLAAVLLLRAPVLAQEVTGPALKAAFVFAFVKFTEWPGSQLAPKAPILICVLGSKTVSAALDKAVKDRVFEGHAISVLPVVVAGPLRACHVLYVSDIPAVQAGQVVTALGDAPVLTFSDIEGFNDLGGIVRFYFEHGQIRYSVNLESIKRARLQISSQILRAAKPQ
jgi:hypothetical protein